MKLQRPSPSLFVTRGTDLSLRSADLTALMRAVLSKEARFRFRARGFSMCPFIKDGDVVTVSPLSEKKAGVGDVVAFEHPVTHGLAVHRIVDRKRGQLEIQGDNAPDGDGLVLLDCVIGVVKRVERQGRTIEFGLGPEKRLIALMSRRGALPRWRLRLRRWFGFAFQSVRKKETGGSIPPVDKN